MHLAHGNMVPFVWDGTYEGLPKTAADMVNLALDNKRSGARTTTMGALQAVVNPSQQGGGLSSRMLQGMANLSASSGFPDLFAPIRPNQKEKYPLIPLENYVTWTRPDGFPADAWQRVHIRLGATPAGVIHGWMTVVATVKEWELWTGLSLPQSGQYVVRGGLVPVEIDTEQDTGRYVEPHVWMHYRITPVADAVEQAPVLVEAAGPVEIAVGAAPLLVGQLRPVGGSMRMRIVIPRSRPLRIGHDEGNELQLFDDDVAPFHARLDYSDGTYSVTDLNTRAGTYVNGHQIPSRPERTPLQDGEEIRLGASPTVSFVFELRPVATSSAAKAPVTA
jgi:hypothetical protein